MPQMGESIAEGTIVRWIKKVGDSVDRDEPLFEISTDKVDAEIPSPAAGVLTAIAVKEGETVPVNSVVATIGAAGEVPAPAASATRATGATGATGARVQRVRLVQWPRAANNPRRRTEHPEPPSPRQLRRLRRTPRPLHSPQLLHLLHLHPTHLMHPMHPVPAIGTSRRRWSARSPRNTTSTSAASRAPGLAAASPSRTSSASSIRDQGSGIRDQWSARGAGKDAPPVTRAAGDEVVPMSVMRRKIAEHMVLSKRTSAHVYSVFEVNYSRVDQIRKAKKDEYERAGAKLTFTSFIAKVAVDCLRRHKTINASLDGDNIIYRNDINLGIAVALENGLIVPVVKAAGEKNTLGLSKAIQDIAERARSKKLSPEEVQGGTFTITNPGNFGAQFGLPIINQPQVAILGVGTIEKRPVVIDDAIGIRLMGFLTLGYDHRLVDGAVADQFMADVKKGIEHFDPAHV